MKRIETPVTANFKQAKILIVEDNDDQWAIIKHALEDRLREVNAVRVATLEQALILLNEWCYQEWEIPRLILLDLYLPTSIEGWQFLKQIKAMPSPFKEIPIVMLSASDVNTDIVKSYELGISAYVVKPNDLQGWLTYFREFRVYWWETVSLPPIQYRF